MVRAVQLAAHQNAPALQKSSASLLFNRSAVPQIVDRGLRQLLFKLPEIHLTKFQVLCEGIHGLPILTQRLHQVGKLLNTLVQESERRGLHRGGHGQQGLLPCTGLLQLAAELLLLPFLQFHFVAQLGLPLLGRFCHVVHVGLNRHLSFPNRFHRLQVDHVTIQTGNNGVGLFQFLVLLLDLGVHLHGQGSHLLGHHCVPLEQIAQRHDAKPRVIRYDLGAL
mmetsp:Transcript_125931/g.218245  ORF Transcript_125931/g.218245 Transcript_125931/m.218245 type:complete len:222 (-) Transcript_125931:2453-3118(-)